MGYERKRRDMIELVLDEGPAFVHLQRHVLGCPFERAVGWGSLEVASKAAAGYKEGMYVSGKKRACS